MTLPARVSRFTPSIPGAPIARSTPPFARDAHPAIAETGHCRRRRQRRPHATALRRDGLERLAIEAGGDEPRLLVFNPHPFPVEQSLRLPYLPPLAGAPDPKPGPGLEDFLPSGPSSHRIQRQDVIFSDLSDERAYWTAPISVPALSYVTLPAAEVQTAATDGLSAANGTLSNGRITLQLDLATGRRDVAEAGWRRICRRSD